MISNDEMLEIEYRVEDLHANCEVITHADWDAARAEFAEKYGYSGRHYFTHLMRGGYHLTHEALQERQDDLERGRVPLNREHIREMVDINQHFGLSRKVWNETEKFIESVYGPEGLEYYEELKGQKT